MEVSLTPFERDLHSNAAFRERCLDDDFAGKLYVSLENQDWYRQRAGEVEEKFGCSWRSAGELVASLRDGKDECYMDWYCHHPGGESCMVFPEVEAALGELGWYPVESDRQSNLKERSKP